MEIALEPEIHTYAGGLGVLAGDTARSCADLGLPIVFVTLVSRSGYLKQRLDGDGAQLEDPDAWDPSMYAQPLGAHVAVEIEGRTVWVQAWLYRLGGGAGAEVPVILLDTENAENAPADRIITDRLYGGDEQYRLKQELILGIGGVRVLRALGFKIRRYHMNEGHSGFLGIELLQEHGGELQRVREQCIFTTHTPVESGHDQFSYDVVFSVTSTLGDTERLKTLGGTDRLNMTRLALNLSGFVNGVAKRHAEVSERMFPGYRVHAITNGIHTRSWAAASLAKLFSENMPGWQHEPEMLLRADGLADVAVWQCHQQGKAALIRKAAELTGVTLDGETALLGFARRITGYKRPDLLFTDLARLKRLHQSRPFNVIIAGKAHPNDRWGRQMIKTLHDYARQLDGAPRVLFLPDYELTLAKTMVAGCDIWLNTPLPPSEASGTSGMKAAVNGVLNVSVLDGWWLEGWIEGHTGWAIGNGAADATAGGDAARLYEKLETVILPLYYENRREWIRMMKESIAKLGSTFTSHRMMRRYASEAYLR
jgi:glycogen phosphorylase